MAPTRVNLPSRTQSKPKPSQNMSASSNSITELKSVFATFDKNRDGLVTKNELSESLKNIGISMSETELDEMIKRVDANGDGLIDFDEFTQLFDSAVTRVDDGGDGYLREAFDVFDGNGDGLISFEELGLVLNSLGMSEGKRLEDCKEMIKMVDADGDGMVNFDEFKVMMKSGKMISSSS
ncbi:hypothetical protein LguiB_010411 [Lonicera macranthoides]